MFVTDCKFIPGEASLSQHRLVHACTQSFNTKINWTGMRKIVNSSENIVDKVYPIH